MYSASVKPKSTSILRFDCQYIGDPLTAAKIPVSDHLFL